MEQQPQTSTRHRLSSAELGPSKSPTIPPRHLNKIGLVNKRSREDPHELTVDRQQPHVVDTCNKLLKNLTDSRRFWRLIVARSNEKWVFYRIANRANLTSG